MAKRSKQYSFHLNLNNPDHLKICDGCFNVLHQSEKLYAWQGVWNCKV